MKNMQVILRSNVDGLGNVGSIVSVKPGFARNFLIPTGKVTPATKANIAQFKLEEDKLIAKAAEESSAQAARASLLDGKQITINSRAYEDGKLYGSIGIADIVKAVKTNLNVDIIKREVVLQYGVLKQTGLHSILIRLGAKITATIQLEIIATK